MAEEIRAEMVANVWKVVRAAGDEVSEGDTLVILESMKMEIPVIAEADGTVAQIAVNEGDVVQEGDLIASHRLALSGSSARGPPSSARARRSVVGDRLAGRAQMNQVECSAKIASDAPDLVGQRRVAVAEQLEHAGHPLPHHDARPCAAPSTDWLRSKNRISRGGPARAAACRVAAQELAPALVPRAAASRAQAISSSIRATRSCDEAVDDVFLGLEVVVERGLGDAEPLGDLAQRGLLVALLGEELQGDVLDARRGCRRVGAARPCSLALS